MSVLYVCEGCGARFHDALSWEMHDGACPGSAPCVHCGFPWSEHGRDGASRCLYFEDGQGGAL